MKFRFVNQKKYYPAYSSLLVLLIYLIILAFSNILGYGNLTILSGDLFTQYIAFIQSFLNKLREGGNMWYSFSLYFGSSTATTYAYYSLSPFNLLYIIPGCSVSAMTLIIITLKLMLAAASFQFFSFKFMQQKHVYTVALSAAYPLCTFVMVMQYQIMWLDALYILPILLTAIKEHVQKGYNIYLPLIYAYLFITNFYMGYIVGIFSALVYIALLIYHLPSINKTDILSTLKNAAFFSFFVLIAAGICCIILFPVGYDLYLSRKDSSEVFSSINYTLPDLFNNLFLGEIQGMGSPIPLLYCGLPILLLFPFYYKSIHICRKEKILFSSVLIFYMLGMQFVPVYAFLHAFETPNWYAFRFAFCVVFLLLFMAFRIIPFYQDIPFRQMIVYATGLILFYSLMIPFQQATLSYPSSNTHERLLLNMIFIISYVSVFFLLRKHTKQRLLQILLLFIWICELTCNGVICMRSNSFGLLSEDYVNNWEQQESELLSMIPVDNTGFNRFRINEELSFNAPSYFHYPGVISFSTADAPVLRSTMSSLGISNAFGTLCDHGYTDVTKMLFSVKYEANLKEYSMTNNPYSLPLGYMVSSGIASYAPKSNPFLSQEALIESMTGKQIKIFDDVPFDELELDLRNMEIIPLSETLVFQHLSNISTNGLISFRTRHDDGRTLYVFISPNHSAAMDTTSPEIIGVADGFMKSTNMSDCAITAFSVDEDENDCLTLKFFTGANYDYEIRNILFSRYDASVLPMIYSDLSRYPLEISNWKDGEISGTVTATEDRPVLFTSIPYNKGWQATVDGVPAKVLTTLNGTFLALVLSPGEHLIHLQYEQPYLMPASAVSCISVLLWLLLWLKSRHSVSKITTTGQPGGAE
ncbi:MAG: YfhO family protein [Lachnospiraceae bacterium]|nr:YfhO family protein [Lachnospiraceae bacterium]